MTTEKPSKELVAHVLAAVAIRLGEAGFEKRKPGILTRPLGGGVLGWVGLNTAHRQGGVLEIGPVVGVRHQVLEDLVATCLGQEPHSYQPPSLSANLGHVMPERRYLSWSFQAEQSCEAPVAAMCEAVAKQGVAFMLANRDLTALTQALSEGRLGVLYQNEYRVSAALFLLGHRVEAEEKLESQLRQLCARNDPAAKSLRSFAGRLRAAMSEGGTQPK